MYVIRIHFLKARQPIALTVWCVVTDATLFMPASPYLDQEVQHGVTVANTANIAFSWGANNSQRFLCADRYVMFHNYMEQES